MLLWHLGCGYQRQPLGWPADDRYRVLNVDCRSLPHVQLVAQVDDTRVLLAAAGEPDRIAAEDVLEHLPRRRAAVALCRWVAALKPGGELHVRVPEWRWIARAVEKGTLSEEEAGRRLYGGQGYPEDTHLSDWTHTKLRDLLKQYGLRVYREDELNLNYAVWARKPCA